MCLGKPSRVFAGFADQRLRKPVAPLDPANRRFSLIVQYMIKPEAAPETAAVAPAAGAKAADAKTTDAKASAVKAR
jgi:hypothetical protein